jgi:hypothetical protein
VSGGFIATGVLEAGTVYRVGRRDGELRTAECDIPEVIWLENYPLDYDVFELPDGTRIYVEYEDPPDEEEPE